MSYENLKYEVDGPIALVTISREKALNALNRQTIIELSRVFAEAENAVDVRVVIVTGAGEKAFVAGADISEMSGMASADARAFAELGHKVGDEVERMTKPVIAAVNGFALGGGCELALACDFIYASQKAKFGQPEVNLGVICGFGGTQRLARRIGSSRAMELILTGDVITADEAFRLGFVNAVCAPEELMPKVKAQALKIAQKGPLAIAASKRAVRKTDQLSLDDGNRLERELFSSMFSTEDQKEGMRAFLEKRPAQFKGR